MGGATTTRRGKKPDIKRAILSRVRVLYAIFFVLGVAIVAKILYIQYGPQGEMLRTQGEQVIFQREEVPAARGDVLSWDGRILSTSVPTYEIRMDFAAAGLPDSIFLAQVDSLAYCLSHFFGDKSTSAYRQKLINAHNNKFKNRYTLLSPRKINHLELSEVERFPIFRRGANRGGFIPQQINRRIMPHGRMAARTIGTVNESGTKVGLEGWYDTVLKGRDGNVLMQRISGQFWVPVADEQNVNPQDGIDVVTTLDVDVQDVAERALLESVTKHDADWGTAILMEVSTGEIRAIANLTRQSKGVYVEDYNYAVGMSLEPGSTFKLATLMALLEAGGASLDESYNTSPGTMMIGKAKVVDTRNYGERTLRGLFDVSSNIGFALAVQKHFGNNPQRFVDHLKKMGLDQKMGLEISGEAPPIIREPGERWWDATTLTMMSYGYALRLTPLKTLSLYNAVANGGKMVKPRFVKEFRQYGQTLRTFSTEELVSSVGKASTIEQVHEALVAVVDTGTAKMLKSPHYKVAAKTGTAQIAQGKSGYTDRFGGRHYLGTMVGYFPADNPKYSCFVAVKTYRSPQHPSSYYGGTVAGPVFRAIADRVYAQSTQWQAPLSKGRKKETQTPTIKPGSAHAYQQVARRMDAPRPKFERGVEWVAWGQSDTLPREALEAHFAPLRAGLEEVPSVIGMGIQDALYLLEREGLVVSFSGVGSVVSQSLKAGDPLHRGDLIVLQLSNSKPSKKRK